MFRVLTIDGGGSKGMFAAGALVEAEETLGARCSDLFDLVYGTSVGSIIAALIATGHSAKSIRDLFLQEIPGIMRHWTAKGRSRALRAVVRRIFGDQGFDGLDTPQLGIVATRRDFDRPMIFKTSAAQAIKGARSFVPGFGASLADAVMASCAARPFFASVPVQTSQGVVNAIDGGFVANNPSLFCPDRCRPHASASTTESRHAECRSGIVSTENVTYQETLPATLCGTASGNKFVGQRECYADSNRLPFSGRTHGPN